MSYSDKIEKLEIEINSLKTSKEIFLEKLKTLSVGDTVYIAGGHGGFDTEYFPQEILDIDLENTKLIVLEKSINRKSEIDGFYMEEGDSFKYFN